MAFLIGFLIGLVFLFWLVWYIAKQFYGIAKEKGYYDRKYFWICLWLGLPGWIMVCALPDRGDRTPVISDELPDL